MKEVKILFLSILAAITAAGCSDDTNNSKVTTRYERINFTSGELDAYDSAEPFGISLFKEYAGLLQEENAIMSPLSAMLDLGMIANGASGETLEEILRALGMESSQLEDFNGFSNRLMVNMKTVDRSADIELANGLFVRKDFAVLPSYKDKVKNDYTAETYSVEEGSMQQAINSWLSKYVPGLKWESSSSDWEQVCSILSAMQFKGAWTDSFDKSKTSRHDFVDSYNLTSEVDYLCDKRKVWVSQNEYFISARLTFGNTAYVIDFYKPNRDRSLDECLEYLDKEMIKTLYHSGEFLNINIRIPKFEIKQKADLIPCMKSLGITSLFEAGRAQLDRLNEVSRDIFISRLNQTSGFSIDEVGAKIETYTQGDIGVGSYDPPKLKDGDDLFFDHPFVFAIRENSSGAILFMGKIGKL